jgi:hypothetical protein
VSNLAPHAKPALPAAGWLTFWLEWQKNEGKKIPTPAFACQSAAHFCAFIFLPPRDAGRLGFETEGRWRSDFLGHRLAFLLSGK